MVTLVIILRSQVFNPIDQSSGAMPKTIFAVVLHRFVIERCVIEDGLDSARQRITLACNVRDLFQIVGVRLVVSSCGPIGVDQTFAAKPSKRRIELLISLRQLNEVVLMLLDALGQCTRFNPLGQHATVMDIVVFRLQAPKKLLFAIDSLLAPVVVGLHLSRLRGQRSE
jgi:hypothetical protein